MMEARVARLSKARPFPGLRPFDFEDHEYFFGRDDQKYALYRLVSRSRFVAVVGSSGSGKSSLVRAGLLPLMVYDCNDAGTPRWAVATLHPGKEPLAELANALTSLSDGNEETVARIALHLGESRIGLINALGEIKALAGRKVLLVVDQFEELFRYASSPNSEMPAQRDEADEFVKLLLEAIQSGARDVHILLTMRSDFIGDCSRFHGLPEAVSASQFLVPAPTRNQLEEAIRNPIETAGATIESALVERLLNDTGNDLDQLPVLQHCLLRLWEQAPPSVAGSEPQASAAAATDVGSTRRLTERHYVEIGRMSEALSRHADKILDDTGNARVVEKVFRSLSELDRQRRAIRRAIPFSQLCEETGEDKEAVRKVVDRFRQDDCSFLTPSKSTVPELKPTTQIDVGHEALLRRWKLVSGDPAAVPHEHGEIMWPRTKEIAARFLRTLLLQRQATSLVRAAPSFGASSIGWLKLEERDADQYRGLLSWVEHEEGALPFTMVMRRRNWWTTRRPTLAWANRYGGGYDRVKKLIERSVKKHHLFVAGGTFAGVLFLAFVGYQTYAAYYRQKQEALDRLAMQQQAALAAQTAEFATRNFKLAVNSAQNLLDQVGEALNRGDIGVKGAKEMLAVAQGIVEQVLAIERTPETNELLVKLLWTASDIYAALGDLKQSYISAKSAKDLVEPLYRADSNNPKILQLIYNSLWRMGDAVADQDTERVTQERALNDYLEAEKLARRLAELEPASGTWQRSIVFVLQKIGDVRQALEEWPSAIAVYTTALEIMQKLAASAPENRLWQRDLANTFSRLGQALAGNRDFDAAMKQYQVAFEIRTELAKKDPKDDVLQSNLAGSHREMARLYAERGQLDDALAQYRKAISILEPLNLKDPADIIWQISLAPFYAEAGDVLQRQNDLPAALEQLRNAYRVRRDLALRDPTNPVRQDRYAIAGMAVADLLVRQHELDEAIKLYREAIDSLDDWRPRYDRDIFRCYMSIGNILSSRGIAEGALTEYRVALAIAREYATKDPVSVRWRRNLTASVYKIGELLIDQGRKAEAIEHYQKVLEFVRGLAEENPNIADWTALAQSLRTKIESLKA